MKFNRKEWSYIFYDFAESAHSAIILAIILPLVFKSMTADAGMSDSTSTSIWGYASTIATLIVALLAPILGAFANFDGYKKKLFITFMMIGVLFTGALGFVPQDSWQTVLILFTFSLIGYTGANIFYDAFLVDTTSKDRYDLVSSTAFGLGYIGGSTIPLIISILLIFNANNLGITPFMANRLSFIITALWWFVFAIPFLKNIKQNYGIKKPKHPIKEMMQSLKTTAKYAFEKKTIFYFLIAYFFYIDGVNTIIKMATTYGKDVGLQDMDLMLALLVTQIVAFPFALLFGFMSKKFKTQTLLLFAISVYLLITIYAFFIKTVLDFWILAILVASCQGGIQALSRSYFAKIIPLDKSNELFGFYNVFGRFSAVMGPAMIATLTALTGNSRYGVLSMSLLFGLGIYFMLVHQKHNQKLNP